ncbi:hypothetical protein RQP46_011023 [Phenoliferia psychrophenolica]
MFFTPNVASLSVYQKFYPDDPSTVDIIGIDYYPTAGSGETEFLSTMQGFHDAYCLNSSHATLFAIGETGLKTTGTISQKLQWLDAITSTAVKAKMPKLVGVSWFNYIKSDDGVNTVDFRIWNSSSPNDDTSTKTKAWLSSGTVASGAAY